jgi:hypothetical protein
MIITKNELRSIIREAIELSLPNRQVVLENDLEDAKTQNNIVKSMAMGEIEKIAKGESNQKGADDSAVKAGAEAAYTLVRKGKLDATKALKAFGIKSPGGLKINLGKLAQLDYNDPKKFQNLPTDWQKVLDPSGQGEFTGRDFVGASISGTF